MKNKTYDFLKNLTMRYIPALEFFILTVFKVWNLPYGAEIGATIAALATALGIALGISTRKYNEVKEYEETVEIEDTEEDEIDPIIEEVAGVDEDE